jgi:hypothetical protein
VRGRARIQVTGFRRGGAGKDSPDTYQLQVTRADGGTPAAAGIVRWSACEVLDKALQEEFGAHYDVEPLPKKRRGLMKLDEKRLEKRRAQLDKYLASVVAMAERNGRDLWGSMAMRNFAPEIFAAPVPTVLTQGAGGWAPSTGGGRADVVQHMAAAERERTTRMRVETERHALAVSDLQVERELAFVQQRLSAAAEQGDGCGEPTAAHSASSYFSSAPEPEGTLCEMRRGEITPAAQALADELAAEEAHPSGTLQTARSAAGGRDDGFSAPSHQPGSQHLSNPMGDSTAVAAAAAHHTGGHRLRTTASQRRTAHRARHDSVGPAFCHVAPNGTRCPYRAEDNRRIAAALSNNHPATRVADFVQPSGERLRFEVRFGAHAVSKRLRKPPASGMVQVNLDGSDNTRIVLRYDCAPPIPTAAAAAPEPASSTGGAIHEAVPPAATPAGSGANTGDGGDGGDDDGLRRPLPPPCSFEDGLAQLCDTYVGTADVARRQISAAFAEALGAGAREAVRQVEAELKLEGRPELLQLWPAPSLRWDELSVRASEAPPGVPHWTSQGVQVVRHLPPAAGSRARGAAASCFLRPVSVSVQRYRAKKSQKMLFGVEADPQVEVSSLDAPDSSASGGIYLLKFKLQRPGQKSRDIVLRFISACVRVGVMRGKPNRRVCRVFSHTPVVSDGADAAQ